MMSQHSINGCGYWSGVGRKSIGLNLKFPRDFYCEPGPLILTNLSELNAALLEALGVNRYAILVRRKSN